MAITGLERSDDFLLYADGRILRVILVGDDDFEVLSRLNQMTEVIAPYSMGAPRAVAESPFWLEINGRRAGSWTCSPEQLPALAIGWLHAEGYLEPPSMIPELHLIDDDGVLGIHVSLPAEQVLQGDLERRHRREHGCGLLYFVRCAPDRIRDLSRGGVRPDPDQLVPHFQSLFELTRRNGSGGRHAAALSDGVELIYPLAEVGRHNAVDKVIGQAILDRRSMSGLGLLLTARISGEIALKAARAGLAWVASRSVPTTLALEIAGVAGLPLLARTMGRERYLHEPPAPDLEG